MSGLQAEFVADMRSAPSASGAGLGNLADDLAADFADDLAQDFADDGSHMDEDHDEGNNEGNNEGKKTTDYDRSIAIADELLRLHKSLVDHYDPRFPELSTFITSSMDYAKTVAILQNGPFHDVQTLYDNSDNMVGAPLRTILDKGKLIGLATMGATTKGRDLSEQEFQNVKDLVQQILKLDAERIEITQQIQSSMLETAPNVAALVGIETAAQLLNATGGIEGLVDKAAGNLNAIGAARTEGTGMATNHGVRAKGYIYHSPIFEGVPEDKMKQGLRMVCAKVSLASRMDRAKKQRDGSYGEQLRQECQSKLDKLHQAAPRSNRKALPAPDEKPSTKRGGKRVRKAKEATAMTEMRKAQNRLAFNKEESEVGYGTGSGTVGLGMLGQQDQGNIRTTQVNKATAAKLSKNNKGWNANPTGNSNASLNDFTPGASGIASVLQARGLRDSGMGTQPDAAGTASTVAFAPAQGLSLVDPKAQAELKRKREAEEDRYFKAGSFTQAPSSGNGGSDGFKVPAVPNKRVNTGAGAKESPK